MKIILANDTYPPDVNGCAYFTHRLAKQLKKRGHEVLVIAPSRKLTSGFSERDGIRIYGVRSVPVVVQKGFRVSPPILLKKSIEKVIKDFQPDIVHLQGHFFVGKSTGWVARKFRIPIVGTNHFMPENLVHYFPVSESVKGKIKRWGWKKFRLVFDKLDVITTPTKTAADLMVKHGFSKPIIPITNGIDLKKYSPRNDGSHIKKRYKIPENTLVMFYLGRLDKEKNVDLILKSLAKVIGEIDVHFAISGKGAEQENLKKMAKRLKLDKHVTFTGFVPDEDLANVYRIADCFVIACEAELQSIVTMEAMASGLPVIAVRAMALPELVWHGENGYLFGSGNADELAGFIKNIFTNHELRKKMAEKSLEIIQAHEIEKATDQFVAIYDSLQRKKNTNRV